MLKKLLIEPDDLKEINNNWDEERRINLENKIKELKKCKEQTYLIGLDIAKNNSKDCSVMFQYRIVDGRYLCEGYEFV